MGPFYERRHGQNRCEIGSSTLNMITVAVHLNCTADTISCWRVKWRNYGRPRGSTNLYDSIEILQQLWLDENLVTG